MTASNHAPPGVRSRARRCMSAGIFAGSARTFLCSLPFCQSSFRKPQGCNTESTVTARDGGGECINREQLLRKCQSGGSPTFSPSVNFQPGLSVCRLDVYMELVTPQPRVPEPQGTHSYHEKELLADLWILRRATGSPVVASATPLRHKKRA